MAKGKASGKTYTSKGLHSNVSRKTTNALRRDYMNSGARIMNQLRAFRAGKRVMVTIENPNKEDRGRKYIRVDASTIWKAIPKNNLNMGALA
jgi:hypothetical protein